MLDKKNHILNLSLNKNTISFYRYYDKIFMKKDIIYGSNVKGICIKDNIIITKILINNNYIYLPDIDYNKDTDLLTAIIKRDIYIETLANKYSDKDKYLYLFRKKNLPVNCLNNDNIMNILYNM